MMKIGVISDIHTHLVYLKKALHFLETQHVDQILCAGDVIDGGTEGDAVVNLLRQRGIQSVLGNHDNETFADQAWLRRQARVRGSPNSLILASETVGYVTSLPLARRFDWQGVSVCLAHGSPHSNTTYVFSTSPDKTFHNVLEQTDARVIVLGHTHEPMRVSVGSRWLLNPGSVYQNRFDASRTCAVLTLPDIDFEVFNFETSKVYPLITHDISTP